MELRNRKDTSQREIFIPRSRGFPVARAQNMKGWAKTSPPLLLNGANVPDNLIEKEIPLKIPPHSLAKCNCVQKVCITSPRLLSRTGVFFLTWGIVTDNYWFHQNEPYCNFELAIGSNPDSIFSHLFTFPCKFESVTRTFFKSGTANRIQWQWLYKHLQIQCGRFFRHIVQKNWCRKRLWNCTFDHIRLIFRQ